MKTQIGILLSMWAILVSCSPGSAGQPLLRGELEMSSMFRPSSSGEIALNPKRALGTPFLVFLFPEDGSQVVALDLANWDHGEFTLDFDAVYEVEGTLVEDRAEIHEFDVRYGEAERDKTRPGWRDEKNKLTGEPIKFGVIGLPERLVHVTKLTLVTS